MLSELKGKYLFDCEYFTTLKKVAHIQMLSFKLFTKT